MSTERKSFIGRSIEKVEDTFKEFEASEEKKKKRKGIRAMRAFMDACMDAADEGVTEEERQQLIVLSEYVGLCAKSAIPEVTVEE